ERLAGIRAVCHGRVTPGSGAEIGADRRPAFYGQLPHRPGRAYSATIAWPAPRSFTPLALLARWAAAVLEPQMCPRHPRAGMVGRADGIFDNRLFWCAIVRLSRTSIADEMREEHRRRVLGE
ncbi:MAG: hypothetical protein WA728_34000, partial [Xanthobacteraceae bacterium]